MSEITRRDVLRRLGLTLMATGALDRVSAQEIHHLALTAQASNGGAYSPKALTDHEYQTLVRLTAPVPGMLNVYTWGIGDGTATAGVRAYLFSADAADYVRREEPGWQAWLQGLTVPA